MTERASLAPRLALLGLGAIVAVTVWALVDWGSDPPRADHDSDVEPAVDVHAGGGDTPERAPVSAGQHGAELFEFSVVDADTGAPLAGIAAYALRSGRVLASTDDEGRVTLPRPVISDLVFLSDSHVCPLNTYVSEDTLRMQRELAAGEVVEVRLHPDKISRRCALTFVDQRDSPVAGVECGFTPVEPAVPPRELEWRAFRNAALVIPSDILPVHFGAASRAVRFVSDDEGRLALRFAVPGRYLVEGRARSGEVFSSEIDVRQSGAIVLRARADAVIAGVVVDPAGAPVGGASVDADGDEAVTRADGTFAIGPVYEPTPIEIEAFGFAPAISESVAPGGEVRIELEPLPLRGLEVRVRAAGTGRPLAGAFVGFRDRDRVHSSLESDADGFARLEVPIDTSLRLAVIAEGFLDWDEVLSADTRSATVELVPATIERRLAARISARVRGRVLGTGGAARVGVVVRRRQLSLAELPNPRPVVHGLPPSHAFVVTAADGSYEIECAAPGEYRIYVDGEEANGATIGVVLGTSHDDIDLHTDN